MTNIIICGGNGTRLWPISRTLMPNVTKGHAKDYVRMMWMNLQADEAEDWVIATGTTTTVRDFVRMSFTYAGIELEFRGEGVDEKGYVGSFATTLSIKLGLAKKW